MLEKAIRVCEATFGNIYRWDGKAAAPRCGAQYAACLRRSIAGALPLHPALNPLYRSHGCDQRQQFTSPTLRQLPDYIERQRSSLPWRLSNLEACEAILMVPMLKEDELIGSFTLYRQEVRPFH